MTFRPARVALSTAARLSAPGCIQRFLTPAAMASSTTFSVTDGGVMMLSDSTFSGSEATLGYAGWPSTSLARGLTGYAVRPACSRHLKHLCPYFSGSLLAPTTPKDVAERKDLI